MKTKTPDITGAYIPFRRTRKSCPLCQAWLDILVFGEPIDDPMKSDLTKLCEPHREDISERVTATIKAFIEAKRDGHEPT